jgi:chromosome segregation protein
MFLKSLSMKGFKSFADPTVLEFEPGITVVVGPNGSGKSNVVDAVTWVLGAQGPRSLRSQKMEDVIFAGTTSRAALGRAEVSLTIDNASGKLPVDMAEVTITRTLFRSGDSEYAINGTPCRLLDIQELLSDSGVGRQQHMIIGQGQLDTVLNARPEDRRAIVEEAAGVLKHRRRRERAERRLAATQENLERLGDLVREVRRQIRPLERQAVAARNHDTLAAELRTVRLHLAGTELASLGERRRVATEGLAVLRTEEGQLAETLERLDADATATAAELASRREEDLASALGRVQGLVERARGTASVLRERSRSLGAALDAAADVDVVSTLEAEGAGLDAELVEAEAEGSVLVPEWASLEAAEAALIAEDTAFGVRFAGPIEESGAPEALARAAERRVLLRQSLEALHRQVGDLESRLGALARRAEGVGASAEELDATAEHLAAEAPTVDAAVVAAEGRTRAAAERAGAAETEASLADEARHRSAARAEALARALSELQGAAGRDLLADVDGVVGALVDLVVIDPGWEEAFEAAAGASVAAVVVENRAAASEALSRLRSEGLTGAVLAPARSARRAAGEAPAGAAWLRPHVSLRTTSTPEVAAVLDVLLADAVRVGGIDTAIDLALERPDLVVVTAAGDRFATSGWRVRSSKGVVTRAAVEEATVTAGRLAAEADAAGARLAEARAGLSAAQRGELDARRELDRHVAARHAADAERSRSGVERSRLAVELAEAEAARDEAAQRVEEAAEALLEVEEAIPAIEEAAAAAVAEAALATSAASVLEERRAELRAARQSLEVRTAGLEERRRVLARRRAEVERRLEGHAEEREAAQARRERLEADGRALVRLGALLEGERERLEAVFETLRADYRGQVAAVRAGGERLEHLRLERSSTEARLQQVRERTRVHDLEIAEVALRADALAEVISHDLTSTPDEVLGAPCPELPAGRSAAEHAADLTERLGALGLINPLALEELSVLEERHRELDTQVDDVRSARRELQEVVRTLDEEIMSSFAAAAADVNEHFSSLVATLFPGGTGRLVLTEPDDLLKTGIEVEVRPLGRNVRRVSLLSGGERSLAALAFLFAVFRSRPSPFYLMDEVEAALDDVNLHRFLGLVREFRAEAQLIIVSHQKRTMETGDALYGVTMAPGGSSQVVSQKVAREAVPT